MLAPDSICFEDRRRQRSGLEPDEGSDGLQHHNEFAYRLVTGDLLSRKVLLDSARAVSGLGSLSVVRSGRIVELVTVHDLRSLVPNTHGGRFARKEAFAAAFRRHSQ